MALRLSKAQRATLHGMFGGVCAYCGQPLGERWHADHFAAVYRGLGSHWTGNALGKPENDTVENFRPSCAPCNISKATMNIEQWRVWLTGHLGALHRNHSTYRLMKAYGLVVETGVPVTFHFERIAKDK